MYDCSKPHTEVAEAETDFFLSLAIKPCSSDFVLLELLTTVNIFPIHLAHTISKTVFEVYLRV